MAYDQPTSSDETDFFLEYLLRCALTAPGAATSPTAGRILARLLVVGAIEGGDELITPYLGPIPGEDATFEVRTYRPGDLVPMEVREGLRAAAALKIALRGARESDEGIEVVSRVSSGLERCVLVRDSTGDFEFRFAGPETLIGEPAECTAAQSAWEATLASWQGWVPDTRSLTASPEPSAGSQAAGVGEVAPGATAGRGDHAALLGDESRAYEQVPEPAEPPEPEGGSGWWAALDEDPTPAPVTPAPVTPAPATAAPVTPTPPAVSAPAIPAPAAASIRAQTEGEPSGVAPGPTLDGPLRAAVQEAVANLVVQIDLGQVDQLIRRALDDDRRDTVEPLARRLSARLGETLELPSTAALVEALSLVIPRPGEVAEVVAADVGALLSETVLRRRPSEPGVDGLYLMSGIEQLQVRLDGLQDQLQKSTGLLQVMDNHLEAGDRRAAIAERISTSVDQEMQRLASRIDEQVSALAANAGGGSELADGVARLTRKLRQSVAQLDRALVRLDELFDRAGDENSGPQVSLRARLGNGSPDLVDTPRPPGPDTGLQGRPGPDTGLQGRPVVARPHPSE